MLRRSPLKRKSWLGRARRERNRAGRGRASGKRIRAGGVLAKGRQSPTLSGWREIVTQARQRARGRCECCFKALRLEPHHVIPRSLGGPDALWNTVMLDRRCHRMVDEVVGGSKLTITHEVNEISGEPEAVVFIEAQQFSVHRHRLWLVTPHGHAFDLLGHFARTIKSPEAPCPGSSSTAASTTTPKSSASQMPPTDSTSEPCSTPRST